MRCESIAWTHFAKGGKEGQVTTLLHTTRKTPPGGRFRLDMPVVARAANLAEVGLELPE